MVADDRADLVATLRWGSEWDIGAAALIAREAGAAVSDAFGQPLTYNKRDPRAFGVLVTSPAITAPRSSGWRSARRSTLPDQRRAAAASSWLIGVMRISTRRLSARPSGVSLLAFGYCSP